MKKILLSMLILSCLWFSGCDYFSGYINQENKTTEESTADSQFESTEATEATVEETDPPIGYSPYNPIPFGDYAEIPASKGHLTMRVSEVIGHTGDIIVKINLTVENLKPNTRLSLSGSDFELFCNNGLIVEADYDYGYNNIEQKYYLDIPYVYDVTMGGDGSVDFYVSFRGNVEDGKILIVSYASNKYIYFALT